jgi:hypothetical protein
MVYYFMWGDNSKQISVSAKSYDHTLAGMVWHVIIAHLQDLLGVGLQ